MSNLHAAKKQIREKYKLIRAAIPLEEKKKMDESITNSFIHLPSFQNCDTILLYVSVGTEVSTLKMISYCLETGKKVALPRCEGKRKMNFYRINSLDELSAGAYSIPEPVSSCEKVQDFHSALCVVPGIAFDQFGGRLGYGGGYYDSFLSGFPGVSLGLCYTALISENRLPGGRYDILLSSYITERGIFVCSKEKGFRTRNFIKESDANG